MSKLVTFLVLALITAGALALRLPQLGQRPLHNDEAVNAVKISALWQKGEYRYDPDEYHGPSLHYVTLPFLWLSSARNADEVEDGTFRLGVVFFGAGLILLLWLIRDGLGRNATFAAAVLTALSPAMVFYSRYFIHETLLVFFTLMVVAGGWRYLQTQRIGWALFAGLGLGLMHATKETFVLNVGAMIGAVVLTSLWARWREKTAVSFWKGAPLKHLIAGGIVAGIVSVVLFSSFFTNWSGPLDSIRSYLPWLGRAGGRSPHIHPWYFYFERLCCFQTKGGPLWSEAIIVVLALAASVAALFRSGLPSASIRLVRFLVFYTAILTTAYCVISYKTPWCMLGFFHGMILLAGVGVAVLLEECRRLWLKGVACGLLVLAGGHLGWQAWRASFEYSADPCNPYVYAQTASDLQRMVRMIDEIGKLHPQGRNMPIKVVAPNGDYWPLPWSLRRFSQVGWWDRLPDDPYAPVMVVGAKLKAALDDQSKSAWLMVGLFELRPGVFFELYVEFEAWKKYVESLPKERD